jgi:hypothetical protein
VWRLASVALFAVSCGVLPVNAQALSLGYKIDDVYEYSLHMVLNQDVTQGTMSTQPQYGDLSAREKVTVLSVDASGAADVTVQLFDVAVKTDVKQVNSATSPSRPAQDVRIAPDGRILSLSGSNTWPGDFPFGAALGGNLFTAVLPHNAVKPGDAWSNDYDQALPFNFKPFHISTRSKYLRVESFQGVNAAVVETTTEISADFATDSSHRTKGTASSDVITWIDARAHRILKSHMSAKMDATLTYENAVGTTNSIATVLKATETADLLPFKA